MAIGFDCIADAAHQRSYLFGNSLRSSANNQVIVGLFNDPSDVQQVGNQNVTPAFVVANGTSDEDRSNALVIYKNGDGVIKGTLRTTKPSSAIPMEIFGVPENSSAQ